MYTVDEVEKAKAIQVNLHLEAGLVPEQLIRKARVKLRT